MSDLARQIQELGPWFHNLHLPDGTQTCPEHPLGDFPRFKWRKLAPHLPEDLHGATVLDIGCNAGFYSLELARRGAQVTALDVDEHYLAQARWAAQVCGLNQRIRFERKQIYELATTSRTWDIVLFLGVLYHLRYPMLGLDIVSRCVGKTLVLQCLTAPGEEIEFAPSDFPLLDREPLTRPGWPKLSFIEKKMAGDQTNWWAPNRACLEAMLRSAGMRITQRPQHEFYIAVPDREGASSMWTWNDSEYWAAVGASDSSPARREGEDAHSVPSKTASSG
ncbi:MAG TPA: TIGR04290 family methyltransferase [Polyangiaceae bacterium]|nr:TIGR04290 family methyltransferase [Polyangiaceae bacterium]